MRSTALQRLKRAGTSVPAYRYESAQAAENMSDLSIVPITLAEANAFVREHHRHHKPVPGAKFCLAVASGETVVGIAIVGRPVARMLDDGWVLEVNRTCTDGTKNANSMLYGACRRATFALGYRKLITYTLPSESGVSLSAAGWKCIGTAGGGTWNRPGKRPRIDTHPLQQKLKWEAVGKPLKTGGI